MNSHNLIPGQPNMCEAHSYCPECEHLLKCAEEDSAWTSDTLEEVRILSFVSAFITTENCSQEDEDIFLRTFWHHMVAELGECTPADMEWAKNAIQARRQKIEELERGFSAEVDKLPFGGDMDLINEYAAKLDQLCGPLMTEEEFWSVINKAKNGE